MPPKKKITKFDLENPPEQIHKQEKPSEPIDFTPIKIQNVVCTCNLGVQTVNLSELALMLQFVEFNPKKFAAATIRLKTPQTTALVFASGNIVCTGAKNALTARLACRKYIHIFQKNNIPVFFKNFKIQNIVASTDVGFPIDVDKLGVDYGVYVSYEPDLFPGLIFRTKNPKMVLLVFRSGKIVITGAKAIEDINNVFIYFFKNILMHYKDKGDNCLSSQQYRVNKRVCCLYKDETCD